MASIIDDLASHSKLYGQELKRYCEPLERYFGVTESAIFHITNNNTLINIHTHYDWIEHCMEKKYFLDDPHIVDPKKMSTGFAISNLSESEEFLSGIISDAQNLFNMYHGITYAKRTHLGYFAATFDTVKENSAMPANFLKESKLVIEFINYLQKQLKPIFNALTDQAVAIQQLKHNKLELQDGIVNNNGILFNKKLEFLEQIGAIKNGKLYSSLTDITKREANCLRLFLEGKTAEATATELSISRRTVEWHFENLKNKLGCKYKKQLLKIAKELDLVGLID